MDEKKRGRPKGSKNKSKDNQTSVEVTQQENNKRIVLRPVNESGRFINSEGVLYEEKVFYSFKNRLKGAFFYKGDDGSDKKIDGLTIRNDITPREREDITGCHAFQEGFIVEWADDTVKPTNYNAMSDRQIDAVMKEYGLLEDKDKFKNYINSMTSIFSLEYFRDKVKDTLPGSIITYIDSRIGELREAEYAKLAVNKKEYKQGLKK